MRTVVRRTIDKSRFAAVLVAFALFAGAANGAFAQDEGGDSSEPSSKSELTDEKRKEYEKHLTAGKSAYSSQNFEKAFTQLKAAHEIYPKSSILFNLGLISEKQGKLERAAKYYRKFIGSPGVSLDGRKRASERLAAVKEILNATGREKTQAQKTNLMPALEAMETGSGGGEGQKEGEQAKADQEGAADDTGEEKADETSDGEPSGGEKMAEDDQAGQKGAGPGMGGGTTDTGERPRVDYNWPIFGSYAFGVGALSGGVVTLIMTNQHVDRAKQAGVDPSRASEHLRHERLASSFATATAGLFIGGTALVGLGTFFVIQKSAQAKKNQTARGPSTPSLSVTVGRDYTGARLSIDF